VERGEDPGLDPPFKPLLEDVIALAAASFFPDFIKASRSSKKPIIGATPVPGPTITTGVSGLSEGYRKVDCSLRTVPTISSPGFASCARPDPGPRCCLPDLVMSCTSPTVIVALLCCAFGEEEIE
jgi:hypothetical protein